MLAGFVQPDTDIMTVPESRVVGRMEDIQELADRHRATDLVVSLSERRGILPVRELLLCKLKGINVLDAPCFYEKLTGKLLVEDIQPSWFIYSSGFRNTPFRRLFKRLLDILWSLLGILLAMPLLPLVALAVKLDSPGPIFFRQQRVGEGGGTFPYLSSAPCVRMPKSKPAPYGRRKTTRA
ncbi:MAG: sugar transferase [Syntrophotaleaceae bacterium]